MTEYESKKIISLFWEKKYGLLRHYIDKRKEKINELDKITGEALIHRVCAVGLVRLINFLVSYQIDLNLKDKDNYSPLYQACVFGDYKLFKCLINNKADIKTKTNGLSLMHVAAVGNNVRILSSLVEMGLDVNLKEKNKIQSFNWPPLFFAIQESNIEAVKFLIANGANINFIDNDGYNCLHHVAGCEDKTNILKVLLKSGADKYLKTKAGYPLELAVAYKCDGNMKLLNFKI